MTIEENPKPPQKRVLAIGSLMVDTIAVIAGQDIERVTMHNATASFLMLEQGRKIDAESISTHIGGGAANVAVCMSRFGFSADVLAVIGDDLNAEKILKHLASEGINVTHVRRSISENTGTSVLVSSHDQNAAIFTHRGANGRLSAEQIDDIVFDQYDLVYIAPLSNESADQFSHIIERAKKAGCFIVANPGIRQLKTRWSDIEHCLGRIDLLAVNEREAIELVSALDEKLLARSVELTGGKGDQLPALLHKGLSSNGASTPLQNFLAALKLKGVTNILVTDGREGAYLFDGSTLFYHSSCQVVPKGTAGAGDAYISTFAAAFTAGWAVDHALYASAVNAASVVSHIDTQSGLMRYDQLFSSCHGNKRLAGKRHWTLKIGAGQI